MIKITDNLEGKYKLIEGTPAEQMLFYCIWQTQLCPNWMAHPVIDEPADSATRQHKAVIEQCNNGRGLLLYYDDQKFEEAMDFATSQCLALGIQIEH